MNKRGSTIFISLMLGIVFFVLGLALTPAIKQSTDAGRIELGCSNVSVSNQDKANCVSIDLFSPLFLGIMLGAGAFLIVRFGL